MPDFTKLAIRNTKHDFDAYGRHVLKVNDPHALIQAAGYLKHQCALNGENVYFRGQDVSYQSLAPSLFRKILGLQRAQAKLGSAKNSFVKQIANECSIFGGFNAIAHEPLLQHYGLRTTWLDIVDNIWVALWFAVHRANPLGKAGEYLHFERRNQFENPTEQVFILLVAVDSSPTNIPGYYKGKNTETVDLRVCVPSIFLRPHAQHGLLFRMRGKGTLRPIDYSPQVRGIISIGLQDALLWLGNAPTLSTHGLFPPPFYDHGYRILLDGAFKPAPEIGSIALVGA